MIIPTKNSGPNLARLLRSVKGTQGVRYELIVVDNASVDDTQKIASSMGCVVSNGGPERSSQRNLGAKLAHSEKLLFLDSDMEIDSFTLELCAIGLATSDALCLRERIIPGNNWWSLARAFERDSYFGTLYYEAARCVRKETFIDIGGYDTDITGLEDMALQAKLIEGGYRIGWIDTPIMHHEEGITLTKYLSKRKFYGVTDERFRTQYPRYWKLLKSPFHRSKALLSHLRSVNRLNSIFYLILILIARSMEFVVRLE